VLGRPTKEKNKIVRALIIIFDCVEPLPEAK
jgi:hypothetical protein